MGMSLWTWILQSLSELILSSDQSGYVFAQGDEPPRYTDRGLKTATRMVHESKSLDRNVTGQLEIPEKV